MRERDRAAKEIMIYLAAPFFNPEQIQVVDQLEALFESLGLSVFSPRKGKNALNMNTKLASKEPVSPELRLAVFNDNHQNIDRSCLVVAVIDGRDVGVVWEIGYAFGAGVPVLTYTNRDYGMNLMLAHSVVGHTKGLESLTEALELLRPIFKSPLSVEAETETIAKVQAKYLIHSALREGPSEREPG